MGRFLPQLLPSKRDPKQRFAAKWILGYVAVLLLSAYVLGETIAAGGNIESWQRGLNWLIVLSIIFGVFAANSFLKYDATDESERRHLRSIRPQIVNSTPSKITIHRSESLDTYRDIIRRMFDGGTSEQQTVTESVNELRKAWRNTSGVVPGLSMKLIYEAVLILIFGAIVILPISWWSGGEALPFPAAPTDIGSVAWGAITAFPGLDIILAFGIIFVIVVGEWLWIHWWSVALTLLLGAGIIAWLDRRTDRDLSVTLYPERRKTGKRVGTWLVAIYAAGAVPAVTLGAVGLSSWGLAIGLFLATAIGLYGWYRGTKSFAWRILWASGYRTPVRPTRPRDNVVSAAERARDEPLDHEPLYAAENLSRELDSVDESWRGGISWTVAAYVFARKVWGLLGLLCLPLLVSYAALAVGTGQMFAVAWEMTKAPWHVQISALTIVIAAVLLVHRAYPDATEELRDALRRASSSQMVRGMVFARGIPIVAIIFAFGVAWPILGFIPAVAVAIIAGSIARIATLVWEASKYRFVEFASPDSGASEVVIEAFSVTDADGETIFIARVDGLELAHRDRDAIVEIVLSQCENVFDDGEVRPTFARYYYEELKNHGHVDIGFVADEYKADIKTRIRASLRESDGEMVIEDMDADMIDEYSGPAYRRCLDELNEIDVRGGKYVLH